MFSLSQINTANKKLNIIFFVLSFSCSTFFTQPMTAATTTSLGISTVVATLLADDDDDNDHYTCRQDFFLT